MNLFVLALMGTIVAALAMPIFWIAFAVVAGSYAVTNVSASIAVANVVDQSPAGFTCQVVIDYPVDPDRLWQALTAPCSMIRFLAI